MDEKRAPYKVREGSRQLLSREETVAHVPCQVHQVFPLLGSQPSDVDNDGPVIPAVNLRNQVVRARTAIEKPTRLNV
jgi:hypothetical protein